ncbi:MAG: LysM peptidoglycan-binding domain-containing protein, partial [Candidatus Peregrinibacteria bacterium]|nr:LysM peptidoglycan-binding domain-containing protein [Candidatus Peregrinibacteria bacterium]
MRLCAENARQRFSDPMRGYSPAQQIIHRMTALSIVLLLVNSVGITNAYDMGGSYHAYDTSAIDTSVNLVADGEGYLTKVMTPEGEAQYLNRGDQWVTHTVQPGDTLSVIAYRYGLNMDTIEVANDELSNLNYLKVGQELRIPPDIGIEWAVESGDTLASIYEEIYEGEELEEDKARTIAINNLSDDGTLSEGATIFVVGGEEPYVPPAVTTVATTTTVRDDGTRSDNTRVAPANDTVTVTPVAGNWVRPTSGVITQWFSSWHYAIDISDTSKPYVVAARGGTVTQASGNGAWNGGYGNVIKIDHGQTEMGNCTTLYAHNS